MAVAHFFVIYVAAKIFFIAYGASDNSISGVCEFSNTRLSCGPGHRCVQLNQQSWACLCKPGYSPTGTQQDSRCVGKTHLTLTTAEPFFECCNFFNRNRHL